MTSYDGLIYMWPGGKMAGIPYEDHQIFLANRSTYISLGKPIPYHEVQVREDDGSVWLYRFSYDDPFNYFERQQFTPAVVTPGGTLVEPQIPLTPLIPGPGIPYYPEVPEKTITPTTPTVPTTAGGGWSDLLPIMAVVGSLFAFGKRSTRKKKK